MARLCAYSAPRLACSPLALLCDALVVVVVVVTVTVTARAARHCPSRRGGWAAVALAVALVAAEGNSPARGSLSASAGSSANPNGCEPRTQMNINGSCSPLVAFGGRPVVAAAAERYRQRGVRVRR